jgi:hypothetical protein
MNKSDNTEPLISMADSKAYAELLKTTKMAKQTENNTFLKNSKLARSCIMALETHDMTNVKLYRHDHKHIFSVFSCYCSCWLTLGAVSPYSAAI